jgi:hypothetical protein
LEDLGVDRRIISKWILRNSVRRAWIELIWVRVRKSERFL